RRSEFRPEKGGQGYQPVERVLKEGQWIQSSHYEQAEVLLSSVMIQGLRPVVKLTKDLEMEIVEKAADDLIWQEEYEKAREAHAVNGEVLADTTYKDGMLFRKGKIWLPRNDALKKLVFENEHDTMVAGHMGMDKTLEMINRNFYWPRMAEDIEDYVRSCVDCQRNKASRHKRHGTLHPLELSYAPWDSISMDFITHLPVSDDCSTVWVIVDRYTKMAHFIPVKNGQKTAEGCAKLFLANVWKLHGLPSDIVSDRDPVFTSTFWAELMKKLDVRLRKSTAFRPQTDGQTERINQTLEHYLRQYCNYEQDDWCEMLPLAEYSYNNSVTTATQMSPFYANYGFHPRTTWPVEMESKNPASRNYAHWITNVHELCTEYLKKTAHKMGRYYDKSKTTAPQFKAGDLVMLNGKNIRTRRAAKKLDAKLFGPFKVLRLVDRSGMSVELELPKRWRVHNVFHTSLLEPYRESTKGLHPPPVAVTDLNYVDRFGMDHEVGYDVDGQQVLEDFEVEEIMDSEYSTGRKKVLYLIKWKGYPERSEWTEEPLEHLPRALVRAFHARHPAAAMDSRLKKKGKK
ncbi:MAG TPA: DDE-type integrase/transposase/recombinase, partial [Puia sp.]